MVDDKRAVVVMDRRILLREFSLPVIATCSRRRSSSHNLLRAQALALQAFARARTLHGQHRPRCQSRATKYPASEFSRRHRGDARRYAYMNRQYLDPVFFGGYPEEMKEIFGDAWPGRMA